MTKDFSDALIIVGIWLIGCGVFLLIESRAENRGFARACEQMQGYVAHSVKPDADFCLPRRTTK